MKIVVAGGGTGGHLFPGMAIAEEFRGRDAGADFIFIGTERGLEKRVLPGAGLIWDDRHRRHQRRGFKSLNALAKIPGSFRVCDTQGIQAEIVMASEVMHRAAVAAVFCSA